MEQPFSLGYQLIHLEACVKHLYKLPHGIPGKEKLQVVKYIEEIEKATLGSN